MLATTRTVIVDEIHALAPNKRGSHLALSLERLAALCGDRLLRIGLSATQKPIDTVARFLVGTGPAGAPPPELHHRRHRPSPGARSRARGPVVAAGGGDVGRGVGAGLRAPRRAHRGAPHHAHLRQHAAHGRAGGEPAHDAAGREADRRAPRQHVQGAPAGRRAAAASAASSRRWWRRPRSSSASTSARSNLVCQLGSPRSIASFLQRVGRSGHAVDGTPKGRLFPQSRDDLVECAALLDSANRGELDRLVIPEQPLDVLAQQIVAEVGARECGEDELLALLRRAWPYRALARERVRRPWSACWPRASPAGAGGAAR